MALLGERPGGCEDELLGVLRKRCNASATRFGRLHEARDERILSVDVHVEPSMVSTPNDGAERLPSRPPVRQDWIARLVLAKPCRELAKSLASGEDRRETNDAASTRVVSP